MTLVSVVTGVSLVSVVTLLSLVSIVSGVASIYGSLNPGIVNIIILVSLQNP